MSSRRARQRANRPAPEGLETRKLLARVFSGTDFDGDTWTLRLVGPGDLLVVNQDGSTPVRGTPGSIDSITVAGPDPTATKLVGHVKKAAGGDGRVFFQNLNVIGGAGKYISGNLGIYSVDIPNFWLGATTTLTTTNAPTISIPQGVVTLRFGGVDTTFAPTGITPPNQSGAGHDFTIDLGLPFTQGTSIVADKFVSSAQAAATAGGNNLQDSITVTVDGRLNVFQANAILGNPNVASTGFTGGGGTIVRSISDPTGGITGQIGFVRVGGNATNFSVQTNDRVSDYFIGGETNNVFLLAPASVRHARFGKGMDNATILASGLETLSANRGAIGSTVTTTQSIGTVTIGGDVVNTNVLSGYNVNLTQVFQTQSAPTGLQAQPGGAIYNLLIAGSVTDSVFAASVEPQGGVDQGTFGTAGDLQLPHGVISAKTEGAINNAIATPDSPTNAFFAKTVNLYRGPIVPPAVPEAPFARRAVRPTGNRIAHGLQPTRVENPVTIPTSALTPPAAPASATGTGTGTTTGGLPISIPGLGSAGGTSTGNLGVTPNAGGSDTPGGPLGLDGKG